MARERPSQETVSDMTPMIDITFQLLIFFLVTMKFRILEGRLDAALPKEFGQNVGKLEEIEKLDIVITVLNEGRKERDSQYSKFEHYVGRRLRYEVGTFRFTDLRELERHLAQPQFRRDETPVTLDARQGTINDDVVQVLDLVIGLGFQKISFAATFEEE